MIDKDYSLDAFNRFFNHIASKGMINPNTAQSRKAATNKIMGILDDSERKDLRNVVLQDAFDRFQNLEGMKYTTDSLQVYLSRARTALSDFIAYVDNPSSFRPATSLRSNSKPKSEAKNGDGERKRQEKRNMMSSGVDESDSYQDIKHIIVPVPLRENLTVKISNLPADLTQVEAERLAAIIKAYAVPSVK